MTGNPNVPIRTVHQIVDAKGKPAEATITSNLWVSDESRFADVTEGNSVKFFTTGKAYFTDLLSEIKNAKTQILIAGWQVAWDALMAPGVRLYDALFDVAQRQPGLRIYVMPWDDHEPVQTYDDQTAAALRVINRKLGRDQVFVRLSPTYASTNASYFAHHQKQVVIDGRVGYVGGMDLTYGRYCDEHYVLKADAEGREGLNRYNGCIAQVGEMHQEKCADPDLLSGTLDNYKPISGTEGMLMQPEDLPSAAQITAERIHSGAWQPKYEGAGKFISGTNMSSLALDSIDPTTLDPKLQPRMPWQDVHSRVEGPAVADLMRNFVNRWNVVASFKERLPPVPKTDAMPKPGKAFIQVLRSAPAHHSQVELQAMESKSGVRSSTGTQRDILSAMVKLIEKARRFIYIENQFFVSDFGKEIRPTELSPAALFINQFGNQNQNRWANVASDFSADAKWRLPRRGAWMGKDHSEALRPPTNAIVPKMLERIKQCALSGSPFHVYITLPVHPEGCLCDATIAVQIYWTMQTISFGSQSLLNGVRRIIKARELLRGGEKNFDRVFADDSVEYQDVDVERCDEFVTLLNLRNWQDLGGRHVTEQIYVHSKTMIVDDLYALIGSANINDRSLLGERDSELAVLIMDGETKRADINGHGSAREVRVFAHELRKELWRKIFGFSDGKAKATELDKAIEQPGCPDSWKLIQRRAQQNAAIYEDAFNWVPRNQYPFAGDAPGASILPTWSNEKKPSGKGWPRGDLTSPMPFQKEFWAKPRYSAEAVAKLKGIRGFITALPVRWTQGENNRFEYPTALVADNEESGRINEVPAEPGAGTHSRSLVG